MPNRKRTIASKVYIPNGGVNFDSDSLSLEADECTDMLNLRNYPNRVQTRSGARSISLNVTSGEPILHTHRYRNTDGTIFLFGFTTNAVWRFDDGSNRWVTATRFEVFDECESLTDWSSDFNTPLSVDSTIFFSGTGSLFASQFGDIGSGLNMFEKSGAGAMDWDASPYTHIGMWFRWSDNIPLPFAVKVQFYSDDATSVLIEEGEIELTPESTSTDSPLNFSIAHLLFEMTTPANFSSVKSIQIKNNAVWPDPTPLSIVFGVAVDYIHGVKRLANTQSMWSTTEFTDSDKGATVVAAASSPPLPIEAESDGPNRAFMYYDRDAGYFRDIDQRSENRGHGPLDASVTGAIDDANTDYTYTLANTLVAKGSLTISFFDGVTKSITDDKNGNLIGDVDASGINSIDYTTGALDFKTDGAPDSGTQIQVLYTSYESITWHPRVVANFHNRVILANVWDGTQYHRWRVAWSDIADLETYTLTNFNDRVDDDVSSYKGAGYIGRFLALFREDSIDLAQFIGGTSTFAFNTAWQDGTFAGRSVAAARNVLFYLGKKDVEMFDGSTSRGIGINRIRNKLFDELNVSKINEVFGAIYPRFNEYWLWIPRTGDTYPTRAFVYRWDLDAWSICEFDETPTMGFYHTQTGDTIDDLVGTIDEQNWRLNDSLLEGVLESPVITRNNTTLNRFDLYVLDDRVNSDYGFVDSAGSQNEGQAIPITLATRDFTMLDLPRKERFNRLQLEASGTTVVIEYSTNFGRTWNNLQTISLTGSFDEIRYWLDANAEYIRFRLTTTTIAQFLTLRWMQVFGVTREKD